MKFRQALYVAAVTVAAVTMIGKPDSQTVKLEHLDKALDDIIAPDSKIEKVAEGYTWTEGPVWMKQGKYLLFADIPANAIWKFTPGQGAKMFMQPSGWAEKTPFGGKEPGSNGMTVDDKGRLTVAGHANRNVWRLEADGSKTILADHFQGKRFNSPNDLVYSKDGSLYFTDPPYGLATQQDNDSKKELKINGVYRLKEGKLQLLIDDISRPNGIAFSPDQKFLYVDCSDPARKIWMKYPVNSDGGLGKGTLFADATSDKREGAPDGMKVDNLGNIFSTGPGGVWILSSSGKHLGTIEMPERSANLAWAADGKTLFITASSGLYRTQVKVGGLVP